MKHIVRLTLGHEVDRSGVISYRVANGTEERSLCLESSVKERFTVRFYMLYII